MTTAEPFSDSGSSETNDDTPRDPTKQNIQRELVATISGVQSEPSCSQEYTKRSAR